MREPIGLYIHVPFCLSKCPYCDFYSLPYPEPALLDRYTQAVTCALADWRERIAAPADTLYFGGGTPSLLGGKRLAAVIEASARHFGLSGAEITLEANPADDLAGVFRAFAAAGGNRVSLGMQSASDRELEKLGRRHRHAQTLRAAEDLHAAGIDNLSLDLMLGIEEQSPDSLADSIEACRQLGASHVSAYLLKIDVYKRQDQRAAQPDYQEKKGTLKEAAFSWLNRCPCAGGCTTAGCAQSPGSAPASPARCCCS